MNIKMIKVIEASELAEMVNEKFNTNWRHQDIARFAFQDAYVGGIHYYYYGGPDEATEDVSEYEMKIILTLRDSFCAADKDIYIELGV